MCPLPLLAIIHPSIIDVPAFYNPSLQLAVYLSISMMNTFSQFECSMLVLSLSIWSVYSSCRRMVNLDEKQWFEGVRTLESR